MRSATEGEPSDENDDGGADVATGKDSPKESRSILFGNGAVRTLPSGGYPILNAFAYGLLAREPIPSQRLLEGLNKFLARGDRAETWISISFDALTLLRCCDHAVAQQFLTQLFAAYPQLLSHSAGVFLIAYSLSWGDPASTKQWMLAVKESRWSRAASAYGELLVLRSVVLKQDSWAGEEIDRQLAGLESETNSDAEVVTGVMHGAASLWREASDRTLLARILALGMNARDERTVRAALEWFRLLDELVLGPETRPIVEAAASGRALDFAGSRSSLLDRLGDIVDAAPDLVYQIARRLIEFQKANFSNFATSAPLDSETLLSIALTLQRLEEPHRSRGLELFELLLLYNAYKVHEVLMDIDRRPGISTPVSSLRRRTRKKKK